MASRSDIANAAARAVQPPKRVRSRLALLRAAVDLLGQEEGRQVRIEDVVSQAGMTRATFYNHFQSREELFDLVAYELTHHFNEVIIPIIDRESDIARRAAMGTRYYLEKAKIDRKWAWAVINVSLNSRMIFGEETFNRVMRDVLAGHETGTFKLENLNAARDTFLGIVFAGFLNIVHQEITASYIPEVAFILLRGLGVPSAKAKRIVAEPLPTPPRFVGLFASQMPEEPAPRKKARGGKSA